MHGAPRLAGCGHSTGASWNEPVLVKGEPFKNLGLPKVVYDREGRLHLTGTKGPRYYRRFPSGDSKAKYQWLTPEWMYHSRGGSFYVDQKNNLWTVFDGQNSGTTNEIYCRMLPSGSTGAAITEWTKALRISEDDKRPSIYPHMVAESEKRLAVVWMDYRQKSTEVYAKVFNNGHWSPDLLISPGADPATLQRSAKPNSESTSVASTSGTPIELSEYCQSRRRHGLGCLAGSRR